MNKKSGGVSGSAEPTAANIKFSWVSNSRKDAPEDSGVRCSGLRETK